MASRQGFIDGHNVAVNTLQLHQGMAILCVYELAKSEGVAFTILSVSCITW